jgi:hypothetical protein
LPQVEFVVTVVPRETDPSNVQPEKYFAPPDPGTEIDT